MFRRSKEISSKYYDLIAKCVQFFRTPRRPRKIHHVIILGDAEVAAHVVNHALVLVALVAARERATWRLARAREGAGELLRPGERGRAGLVASASPNLPTFNSLPTVRQRFGKC